MSTIHNKSIVRRLTSSRMFASLALLIALLISGLSPSLVYANSMVPYQASLAGKVAITGAATASLSGVGIATYLGVTKYSGSVTNITPTPTGMTNDLLETLTAANGDSLTISCTEVAVQTSPNVFHGTDHWVVKGGTGRFTGAVGSGTGDTLIDLNKGVFAKHETGTISAPSRK